MPEMNEVEVPKPIEVYEEDLTVIHDTLASVYHFCLSYDLFNQYKNLSDGVQLSPLTKQIRRVQTRVAGILEDHRNEQAEQEATPDA